MIGKKAILSELERLESIKTLVESYQEITATRMRKIRDSVLNTRQFLEGVNAIFNEVKKSYKHDVEALMKKSKGKDKNTFLIKNGKKVTVLISANSGLYGDIVRKSFEAFAEEVKKEKTDMVIVGKQGKFLFDNLGLKGNPVIFNLPDNHLDQEGVAKIVKFILDYQTIVVCYGQFQSVIKQEPTRIVISDRTNEAIKEDKEESVRYLFEPSIQKILQFFETEIFASLFEETVNESHLAKFASRLITLDKAVENVKNGLKKTQYQKRVLFHRTMNKKQLEAISGISVWKGSFYG
jgi:F-type H+-transporting ATPase subunit gamma